jgi:thiamine kinase-like enzyme
MQNKNLNEIYPEVLKKFRDEYPYFDNKNVIIKKRFTSARNNYNTFLLEDSTRIFVLKSPAHAVYKDREILNEWRALNYLEKAKLDSPRLLFPKHTPKDSLLISYLEGGIASEIIKDEDIRKKVFYETGLAVAKLHNHKVKKFGNFFADSSTNWEEYINTKMIRHLDALPKSPFATSHLYTKIKKKYFDLKILLKEESTKDPVFLQQDMYFDNFIINPKTHTATVIDYAYAIGGRPLYDLSKLYIIDFYEYPEHKDIFLNAYWNLVPKEKNFNEKMELYIIKSALGLIYFFNLIGNIEGQKQYITILSELVDNKGKIVKLLK